MFGENCIIEFFLFENIFLGSGRDTHASLRHFMANCWFAPASEVGAHTLPPHTPQREIQDRQLMIRDSIELMI